MPELPEVETIRLQLEKTVVGRTIAGVEALHQKSLTGDTGQVTGKRIIGTRRYGKMLVLDVKGNTDIGIHLKMSGQLLIQQTADEAPKHTRVIIRFTDGSRLVFNDQRIFGWIKILPHDELVKLSFVQRLGPEPWDISDGDFFAKIRTKSRAIKLVILDQEVISGVGNIYANDALWEAGILPTKPAKELKITDATILRMKIIDGVREGIEYGGSTGQDGKFVHVNGQSGKYQNRFRVYDREAEPCLRNDGGVIKKIQLGGRGTYFCPVCQK